VSEVKNITIFPSYYEDPVSGDLVNDFALVGLKKALTLNRRTQIIKLPDSDYTIADGKDVLVSGHGNTKNELHSKELLRGVVIKIKNFAECNTEKGGTLKFESMICGDTSDGQDSCQV
jgi:hypothetical protein